VVIRLAVSGAVRQLGFDVCTAVILPARRPIPDGGKGSGLAAGRARPMDNADVPGVRRSPEVPLCGRAMDPDVGVGFDVVWLIVCSFEAEGIPGSMMKVLDPLLNDLSPRHLEIYWRYQVVRTAVDFGAATCFLIGSALFFSKSTTYSADWLFLIGSVLFAIKPTIDIVRSVHLNRLPLPAEIGQARSPHAAGAGK